MVVSPTITHNAQQPSSRSNRHSGFTLIEMVMTIVIIGIIAAVLSPFLRVAIEGFVDTRARTDLTASGRLLIERLTRDLREADPGSITVSGSSNSQIQFTILEDLNGLVPQGTTVVKTYQACRTVIAQLSGSSLLWDDNGDGTTDSTLSTNVSSISFGYSAGTTIRSGVVSIDLTLSADGQTVDIFREIHLRNTLGSTQCI